jgi:glycosyltransferase involved in cell wall biosynthesis
VSSDYGCDEATFPADGFQAVLLPCQWARWGFYFTPGLVGWARRHLQDFDVVHLHNVRTFQNIVVANRARYDDVPYVLSAHGSLPVIIERKVAKRAFDWLFGRRLIAGASTLIAVSLTEVKQFVQYGVERATVTFVPNALDTEEFSSLPPPGTFRRMEDISAETKLVLSLGRVHRRKGIDHLIEAFVGVVEEIGDCILVVAGPDDGDLPRLRAIADALEIRDYVRFPGAVYGDDKLAAYVDADVLASTGVYEVFGLVPFEALMCDTPVIVTDDCGSGELISEAEAGYVVPYGDVDSLRTALRAALAHPKDNRAYVLAGKEFIRKQLDWHTIAENLEDLYAGATSTSAGETQTQWGLN